MIGATAKSEQFRDRVASDATKGSRKGYALNCGGDNPLDHLDPEQRRASLVAVANALQIELAQAKAAREVYRVKQIGARMFEVMSQIKEIRKARKSANPLDIANLFVDICREQMTKPQFHAVMTEANRRQRAELSKEPK